MAFLSKDLSVLAYANGFTMWYYKTSDRVDALSDLWTYFQGAKEIGAEGAAPHEGDMCIIHAKTIEGTLAAGTIWFPDLFKRPQERPPEKTLTTTTKEIESK